MNRYEEAISCYRCQRDAPIYNSRFKSQADRSSYIAREILPAVIELMGAETENQKAKISTNLNKVYNFDGFLKRLEIVLQGITNWNDKIDILEELKCCHFTTEKLALIDFQNRVK